VIGIVWVFLFAAMGAARWLVASREDGRGKGSLPVLLLVLFCASYPLYTLALSSLTLGLIGNAATALFALWVAARVRPVSRLAAGLVTAPAVWVAFASYLIAEQMLGRSI
jgi:tryptophan-rich sensory protein